MFGVPKSAISAIGIEDVPSGTRIDKPGFVAPTVYGGTVSGLHGRELFEKIIVTPRKREIGFVLADIAWQTNVWNTHQDTIADMTGISIINSNDIRVENPHGIPLSFGPMQGRDFEVIVPREGDATIQALIVFDFPGETGTDQAITGGMRIVAFPAEAEWSEPVKETTQYLTDVLSSYTAQEQRFALRKNPRTRLAFQVLPGNAHESAAMEAMLYGWQTSVFGVPFWPDAQKITQNVAAGGLTISCDTSNRKFTAGGLVMLWRSFFENEVASISAVNTNSVTVSAPINDNWPDDGGTYAVPILLGRWQGEAVHGRLTPWNNIATAEFLCDPMPDAAPAVPVQVYGYDVFEIQPNTAEKDRLMSYGRTIRTVDAQTGRMKVFDRSGVAISTTKGFLWTLHGREEIAEFRAWFARRSGRLVPFWLPTWQHDLFLHQLTGASMASIAFRKTGYAKYQFEKPARRYIRIALLDGSGRRYYRRITAAVEGTDAETLTLDSPVGIALRPDMCMISFLHLVRSASDAAEISWITRDVAEVKLEFVELPKEVIS